MPAMKDTDLETTGAKRKKREYRSMFAQLPFSPLSYRFRQ